MTLSALLSTVRTERHLSVLQMAVLTHVSEPQVSNLLTGRNRNPSIRTLVKITGGLGLDLADVCRAAAEQA